MLYDYQSYPQIMAPQMQARPSFVPTASLFQMISIALDRNLNDYLQKKNKIKASFAQKEEIGAKNAKMNDTIIIDLESGQENNQPVTQQKEAQYQNSKFSPVYQTLIDTNQKEELVRNEENHIASQISEQLQKSQSIRKESEKEQNTLSLRCIKKQQNCEQFTLFSIECPKIGITNAQLLRKKQKLLRRKVVDWSEVDQKGPRQRREIRMLKN